MTTASTSSPARRPGAASVRRILLARGLAPLREDVASRAPELEVDLLPSDLGRGTTRPGDVVVLAGAPAERSGSLGEGDLVGRIRALAAAGLERLVLVSSSEVYGTSHHLSGMVTEDQATPREERGGRPEHWRRLEHAALDAAGAACVVVLRPVPVLWPAGEDAFSRRLRRRLVPTPAGFDATVQFLSPRDLAGALVAAALGTQVGSFNVAPRAPAHLRRALGRVGARRIALPSPLERALPEGRLDALRRSCTVSGERFEHAFGWMAEDDTLGALASARAAPVVVPESVDEFGLDPEYIRRKGRGVLELLHRWYWRVEVSGLENVPREGPGVLTAIHRGFMPFDGVLLVHLLTSRIGRTPRFLIHPSLVKAPFLTPFMQKLGGVLASTRNADRVLSRGELLGFFPEGIRGAFRYYRRAYELGRFGRDEFMKVALRNRVPILPCVTVGSAEIYPILAKVRWGWFERLTEWPCLPLTPTFPLLPVPLPSKWHTRFLEPIHVEELHPPEAAEDPSVVRRLSDDVRRLLQSTMTDMRARRRHVFFGSLAGGAR